MSRTQLLQCKRYFNSDGKVRAFLCGWFKNKVNKCYSGGGKIALFNFHKENRVLLWLDGLRNKRSSLCL